MNRRSLSEGWERLGPLSDCTGGLDTWKKSLYTLENPFYFYREPGPHPTYASNRSRQHTNTPMSNAKGRPPCSLRVPLRVTASQARRLRAHLAAARQLYNAILS